MIVGKYYIMSKEDRGLVIKIIVQNLLTNEIIEVNPGKFEKAVEEVIK